MFTNLSCVCKFFANFCLPRVFEFVEFSGSTFRDRAPTGPHDDPAYIASREGALCARIAAKEPLALALAKAVRECHFKHWKTGSWEIRRSYIAGMLHMTNIRELKFFNSFVNAEHWNAIATLLSLEKLTFTCCRFLQHPAGVEPEKRAKVKVSCLRLAYGNSGVRHLLTAIDAQHLHSLDIDHELLNEVDWHSLSSLTVLHFRAYYHPRATQEVFMGRLHTFLMQASRSLETLGLVVDIDDVAQDTARRIFDDPAWKKLSFLRSLSLVVVPLNMIDVSLPVTAPSLSIAQLADSISGGFLDPGGRWSPHKYKVTHTEKVLYGCAVQGDLCHAGSMHHT